MGYRWWACDYVSEVDRYMSPRIVLHNLAPLSQSDRMLAIHVLHTSLFTTARCCLQVKFSHHDMTVDCAPYDLLDFSLNKALS